MVVYEAISLDTWTEKFHDKFSDILGSEEAGKNWLWFSGNIASPIAEHVREEEFKDALDKIVEAFEWICCFVQKHRSISNDKVQILNPLSAIVWNKYSGMCYACAFLQREEDVRKEDYYPPCKCAIRRADIKNRDRSLTEEEKRKNLEMLQLAKENKKPPKTLDEWVEMIKNIYESAHLDMPLSAICLHFIEEIGEVARSIQKIELTNLSNSNKWEETIFELEAELADVFSWMFGLYNKIIQYIEKITKYYIGVGISEGFLPKAKMSDLAKRLLV